ncbi:hypothetical protein Patl1_35040 [Pistacia atlantica]|uniref:Uncharacterized protein n=1 Tax=Pistacia atlantica TaxID=434234 RepID=A0ACC0ZPU7_9ROSI|nr:hypothetical protein Patl1_35040 [Pistacia atlantica]
MMKSPKCPGSLLTRLSRSNSLEGATRPPDVVQDSDGMLLGVGSLQGSRGLAHHQLRAHGQSKEKEDINLHWALLEVD